MSTTHHTQEGIASWYGKDFHGRHTASGEIYNMYGLSAAHKVLPLGTRVRVINLSNSRSVIVPINDRGPFIKGRVIDMSYGAAKKLGMVKEGLAKVRIEVIKTPDEKTVGYFLQFGAFTERQNAVAVADRLGYIGYPPRIVEAIINGRQYYRVRLGPFKSIKKARTLSQNFNAYGIDCIVTRL